MREIECYLAKAFNCTIEDLNSNKLIVTKKNTNQSYVKVLAYQNATVVCCSEDYYLTVNSLIENKSRDEVFELPFVYGQTLHYVYDPKKTKPLSLFKDIKYQFIDENLDAYLLFKNAVDEDTKEIIVAKKDGQVVGVAGASMITEHSYEIGVDVLEGYRQRGLGSQLVQFLSGKLVSENIIPIYAASSTNIASQRIAQNAGYKVLWVDTYGTINDAFDVYKNIRNR